MNKLEACKVEEREHFEKDFCGNRQEYGGKYFSENWGFYWIPQGLVFKKVKNKADLLTRLQHAEVVASWREVPAEMAESGMAVWHLHIYEKDLLYMEEKAMNLLAYCYVDSEGDLDDSWGTLYGSGDIRKYWDKDSEIMVK